MNNINTYSGSTLVIHPCDKSTDFLKEIYKDQNWKVITEQLKEGEIRAEIEAHERIVMLGHGTEYGLFHSGFTETPGERVGFRYLISETVVDLLEDKECIYIWCNADEFVRKFNLSGFHTGMIISEETESEIYQVPYTPQHIKESNEIFAGSIGDALAINESNGVRHFNIVDVVKDRYISDTNEVIKFNSKNIYWKDYMSEAIKDKVPTPNASIKEKVEFKF